MGSSTKLDGLITPNIVHAANCLLRGPMSKCKAADILIAWSDENGGDVLAQMVAKHILATGMNEQRRKGVADRRNIRRALDRQRREGDE